MMTDPATFQAQLNTLFRVEHDTGAVALRLAEVSEEQQSGGMRQFSLFFHGPGSPILPQGTYSFDHDALGPLALFIVPIVGSSPERIVYQACFSRPAPPAPPNAGR
jgi:uncharacterized protein DUF6916